MYRVVKYVDFDKPSEVIEIFESRVDAEEFAWWRRRDETDDHVRYAVLDDYSLACPVVDNRPLVWSVGKYFGRHRRVVAWFADEHAARDYVERCKSSNPGWKFDCLKSLF